MLLLSWLACSNPAPSPPLGKGSAYTVYDTSLVDSGQPEPGVQLQFLDEEGHGVGDEPVPWTMVNGPAGGWTLTLRARVTNLPADELPFALDATALMTETEGFVAEGYRVLLEMEEDGAAYLGPWPQTDIRLFMVSENPYDIEALCAREGLEAPLHLRLERLDQEEPADVYTFDHTVRFLLDPLNEPYCH